jgi:hypothetical protein
MDAMRFEAIVAAYGADPKRWPEAERAQAIAFAARSEAATALARARALDAILDESGAPTPLDLTQIRRFIAAAPKARAALPWRPVAAMAACALLGLALGFSGARQAAEAQAAAAVLEMALIDGGAG